MFGMVGLLAGGGVVDAFGKGLRERHIEIVMQAVEEEEDGIEEKEDGGGGNKKAKKKKK